MNDANNDTEALAVALNYIYDAYRTALLNRKYYGDRLEMTRRLNLWAEILIAIGATTSGGVAGLAIWGTITGQYVWLWISGVATVVSVIKPAYQFGKSIENYTKLYAGHTNIYLTLREVVEDINKRKNLTEESQAKSESSRQLNKELGGLDDPRPKLRRVKNFQDAVNREIPPDSLWMP